MMNLEFLFWASKVSGDKSFYNISTVHADNTLKNHFRADNSSYHVICYGPNGEVQAKKHTKVLPMSQLGHVDKHGVCMATP
jgi:hypothetical protein